VTVPLPSLPVAPAEAVPPVRVPVTWLLDHASYPVRARALLEFARSADLPKTVATWSGVHPLALQMAMVQRRDGTWPAGVLSLPGGNELSVDRVGTIPAVRRLVEYGWDPDSPPLTLARRLLFRLLAEDVDPTYLYELGAAAGNDEDLIRRGRTLIREAAAAALAQLGHESDPRLRGAGRRVLDRLLAFLKATLSAQAEGAKSPQSSLPEAVAPPSVHALVMLAYMPHFRSEHHELLDRLFIWLSRTEEDQPTGFGSERAYARPHLVVGDPFPTPEAADADVAGALAWLEIMGRLGFLRRHAGWTRILDHLLAQCGDDGVWRPAPRRAPKVVASTAELPARRARRRGGGLGRRRDLPPRAGGEAGRAASPGGVTAHPAARA
jgi:hypothetical protein